MSRLFPDRDVVACLAASCDQYWHRRGESSWRLPLCAIDAISRRLKRSWRQGSYPTFERYLRLTPRMSRIPMHDMRYLLNVDEREAYPMLVQHASRPGRLPGDLRRSCINRCSMYVLKEPLTMTQGMQPMRHHLSKVYRIRTQARGARKPDAAEIRPENATYTKDPVSWPDQRPRETCRPTSPSQ